MPKEEPERNALSVHLLNWPKQSPEFSQASLSMEGSIESELKLVMELIPDIAKLLEEKRGKGQIGSSFDAQIILLTNSEIRYKYLESLKSDLCEVFKVSQVEVRLGEPGSDAAKVHRVADIGIIVNKACGQKCVRCWNYSLTIGKSVEHPLVCQRCAEAISEEKLN
jgi:isoleucyl-tRNA synthetase